MTVKSSIAVQQPSCSTDLIHNHSSLCSDYKFAWKQPYNIMAMQLSHEGGYYGLHIHSETRNKTIYLHVNNFPEHMYQYEGMFVWRIGLRSDSCIYACFLLNLYNMHILCCTQWFTTAP